MRVCRFSSDKLWSTAGIFGDDGQHAARINCTVTGYERSNPGYGYHFAEFIETYGRRLT